MATALQEPNLDTNTIDSGIKVPNIDSTQGTLDYKIVVNNKLPTIILAAVEKLKFNEPNENSRIECKLGMYKQKNDSGVDIEIPDNQQPESNKTIIILQTEKSAFKSSNQLIGHWNQLVDTEEAWTSNSQLLTPTSISENNSWTPMYVWSPNSHNNWRNNNPVMLNWRRFKIGKKDYFKCVGIALIICVILAVCLVVYMHTKLANHRYDSSTGPRGSAPGVNIGSPLPIFGVLNDNQTGTYFGVTLDWSKDDPEHFNLDLGRSASIQDVVFFMNDSFSNVGFANSSGFLHKEDNLVQWSAALVRGTGAIMGITIIPTVRLTSIKATAYTDIAIQCKEVNEMGIPILLRFAPDMNSNWMQYGQYPQEFIQAFKNITLSIRNQTNNTAMVWSPYSGAEYPFTWTPLTPYPGQPRFSQVDTNQDGKFDTLDDPYQPYYPGDDYVDWVGLSIFYPNKDLIAPKSHDQFQKEKPTPITTTTSPLPTSTILPPTLKFQQQSSPAGVFESQLTNTGKPFNFYNTFALAKQKPLALYTGAAFLTGQDVDADPIELQFKSSWFSQILNRSLLEKFPLIKGLLFYNAVLKVNETNYNSWFKFDKTTMADYTFTKDTKVLGYFRAKVDELSLGNVTNSSVFLRQQ